MSQERTAEDWGRVAVSLPGWRWMPGMLARNFDGPVRVESVTDDQPGVLHRCRWTGDMTHADIRSMPLPDPDDPATEGCLLKLAGAPHRLLPTVEAWLSGAPVEGITSLGRAVIADVRDQWGRWPGGAG
jgi:hypothetical protein